jgi:hypothetical protein
MAPFPELLKVMGLALMPPAKVKHRKPHQAMIFVGLLYLRRVLLSSHWLLLFRVCPSFCGSRNQISGIDNSVEVRVDMTCQLPSSAQNQQEKRKRPSAKQVGS